MAPRTNTSMAEWMGREWGGEGSEVIGSEVVGFGSEVVGLVGEQFAHEQFPIQTHPRILSWRSTQKPSVGVWHGPYEMSEASRSPYLPWK